MIRIRRNFGAPQQNRLRRSENSDLPIAVLSYHDMLR